MKLRRKFVEAKYASLVEDIYNGSAIPACIAQDKQTTHSKKGGVGDKESTSKEEPRDIQICSSDTRDRKKREAEQLQPHQSSTKRMSKL